MDEQEIAERLEAVEKKSNAMYTAVALILLGFVIIGFILNFSVYMNSSSFQKMFKDMLGGEPLPVITEYYFYTKQFIMVGDLICVIASIFCFYKRDKPRRLLIIAGIAVYLSFKWSISTLAMFLPLMKLIEMIGA
ncbi:MAG: hypothetical protein HRT89_18745 [Lentisphaeria bacterium]|nr:hypothetical protein [Lentisphaeria bacterium]NQZ70095.1 hypothetical protein [Lentisphaeria bacterium]